jgi:hypothetical protein
MATELRFKIGPHLATYIRKVSSNLSEGKIAHLQESHYGHCRLSTGTLKELVEMVSRRSFEQLPIDLPRTGQLHLWGSQSEFVPRINVHHLGL